MLEDIHDAVETKVVKDKNTEMYLAIMESSDLGSPSAIVEQCGCS